MVKLIAALTAAVFAVAGRVCIDTAEWLARKVVEPQWWHGLDPALHTLDRELDELEQRDA